MTPGPQLLGDHVKTVIFSCSEYEAKNYGVYSRCICFTAVHVGRQVAFC